LCNVEVSSIVNSFLNYFYHIGKFELIGHIYAFSPSHESFISYRPLRQEGPQNIGEVHMEGEGKLWCLGSSRKCIYSCFECNYYNELCYNCVVSCHAGHSISFVPQSLVIFKSCQCREYKCNLSHKVEASSPESLKNMDEEKEDMGDGSLEID
jgi:hypothetical protein